MLKLLIMLRILHLIAKVHLQVGWYEIKSSVENFPFLLIVSDCKNDFLA